MGQGSLFQASVGQGMFQIEHQLQNGIIKRTRLLQWGNVRVWNQCEGTLWAALDIDLLSEADHIFDVGEVKSKLNDCPWESDLRISVQWAQFKHQWFANIVWHKLEIVYKVEGIRVPLNRPHLEYCVQLYTAYFKRRQKVTMPWWLTKLPGTVLNFLYVFIHLTLSTTLCGKYHHYSCITDR